MKSVLVCLTMLMGAGVLIVSLTLATVNPVRGSDEGGCWSNTWEDAAAAGCTLNAIVSRFCTQMESCGPGTGITDCGVQATSQSVRIGTSLVTSGGYSTLTEGVDDCYLLDSCSCNYVPLNGYHCQADGAPSSSGDEWGAQQAEGASC